MADLQTTTTTVARSLQDSTTVAHHHLKANTTTEAGSSSSSSREDTVDTDKVRRQDRTASHLRGHRTDTSHQEDLRLQMVVTGAVHPHSRLPVTPVGIQAEAMGLAADKDITDSSNRMDNNRTVSNRTVKTLIGKGHTGKVLLGSPGMTATHLAIDRP